MGVATGALYQSDVLPPTNSTDVAGKSTTEEIAASGWVAPHFEGNAQIGVSERVALNFHFSAAGIAPGAKFTFARSPTLALALVPQVGLGYFSQASRVGVTGADGRIQVTNPASTQVLLFQPGAKLLLSHRSGFYAGIGYDWVFMKRSQSSTIGSEATTQVVETSSTQTGHQLGAALGVTAEAGRVVLRPEVAVVVIPSFSTQYAQGTTSLASSGGYSFAVFPSLTIAVRNAPKSQEEDEEEEQEVEVPPEWKSRAPEPVPDAP